MGGYTGRMHRSRGGGGGASSGVGEHAASSEIAANRGGASDEGGEGSGAQGSGHQMRHSPSIHHGSSYLLHRSAQGTKRFFYTFQVSRHF